MEKVKELFKSLEYTEDDIKEIINAYGIANLKPETLLNNVKRNYEFLISLGYTQADVIKMTKSSPSIYGYSIENMKQKIEDIIDLGYSKEDVIKMTKSLPAIYGYSIENMKQKIEDIIDLGYSKEDVIKMTKSLPAIYNYSIENMKQKIEDIIDLGYSKEDVIKMTKSLPAIYGYSIENMKQKIAFYDSIGLHSLAINVPNCLMQSVELSYARYMFYKSKGICIDEKKYSKLFIGQKQFEKAYGITKDELLKTYDYKKYLEGKSAQELGEETEEEQGDIALLDKTETVLVAQLEKGKENPNKSNE